MLSLLPYSIGQRTWEGTAWVWECHPWGPSWKMATVLSQEIPDIFSSLSHCHSWLIAKTHPLNSVFPTPVLFSILQLKLPNSPFHLTAFPPVSSVFRYSLLQLSNIPKMQVISTQKTFKTSLLRRKWIPFTMAPKLSVQLICSGHFPSNSSPSIPC
jgi:hypothetical protein